MILVEYLIRPERVFSKEGADPACPFLFQRCLTGFLFCTRQDQVQDNPGHTGQANALEGEFADGKSHAADTEDQDQGHDGQVNPDCGYLVPKILSPASPRPGKI